MTFADKWEATEWMCRKQLGRRNLTPEQQSYLRGKQYELDKAARGGDRKSENFSKCQNDTLIPDAADRLASEHGVSRKTIHRDAQFAAGVDELRKISPDAANKVLTGDSKVTKAEIMEIPKMEPECRERIVSDIQNPSKRKEVTQDRKDVSIDALLFEINFSASDFVRHLKLLLVEKSTAYQSNEERGKVLDAISDVKRRITEIENIIK